MGQSNEGARALSVFCPTFATDWSLASHGGKPSFIGCRNCVVLQEETYLHPLSSSLFPPLFTKKKNSPNNPYQVRFKNSFPNYRLIAMDGSH